MRWSEERILTTHAGSLPRPPELVRLYARRARGGAVDAAALDAAGQDALRWVVPKQIAAGVDVGNNGAQRREGFFLYVQHRMSGFGGSWRRRPRAAIARMGRVAEDVVWAKLEALADGARLAWERLF